MRGKAWFAAVVVAGLLALIALACSEATPNTREIAPRDLTTSPEPTATETPTPTETLTPSVTPTPTNTPTPTMQPSNAGVHVYAGGVWTANGSDCATAVAAVALETWAFYGSGSYPALNESLHICNMNAFPVTCTLYALAEAKGWSTGQWVKAGCSGSSDWCAAPANWRIYDGGTSQGPYCYFGDVPVGGNQLAEFLRTTTVQPWAPSLPWNVMDVEAYAGATSFGKCVGIARTVGAVSCGAELTLTPPTPTETPRPSRTPSPTPSPTVTRTPGPTRPTATATITPTAWGGVTCPTAVVTVDGSRADWTAIPATPMLLSAANASYIWPAATPSAADLSGTFWCAHSADTLFLSGVITDSVLYQDSAPVDDDAAQIAVDGWGDGFLRYRADDHELTITQDGRLRDLATLPITATVATTLTVAGWQFEIGIPRTVLELPTLTQRIIGLVFGLIDDDDGGQLDQQIIAPTRSVLLQ